MEIHNGSMGIKGGYSSIRQVFGVQCPVYGVAIEGSSDPPIVVLHQILLLQIVSPQLLQIPAKTNQSLSVSQVTHFRSFSASKKGCRAIS